MALFWFLLALVLLVVALVILRLDAQQRGGRSRGRRAAVGDGSVPSSGEGAEDTGADDDAAADDDDADEAPHPAPPAGGDEAPDESASDAGAPKRAVPARRRGRGRRGRRARHHACRDTAPVADDEAPAAATASDETRHHRSDRGASPRLLDRVRALLPARRASGRAAEPVEAEPEDPLAGSPVVRWLEDREFAPTPTPAPEFRHGDFAGGLSALGTVSHGVFRGRRAIMGVTGGRTVLALRRDTASDVVLDLSRPDVDAEPGFHDAGEVGVLEARTSDLGRLDLLDRDRLADSVRNVPASVRRIWAEGEWVAATIDGVDDPSGWDDVVMALHGAADVVAPFLRSAGRALPRRSIRSGGGGRSGSRPEHGHGRRGGDRYPRGRPASGLAGRRRRHPHGDHRSRRCAVWAADSGAVCAVGAVRAVARGRPPAAGARPPGCGI